MSEAVVLKGMTISVCGERTIRLKCNPAGNIMMWGSDANNHMFEIEVKRDSALGRSLLELMWLEGP